jgi:hypothetical protein
MIAPRFSMQPRALFFAMLCLASPASIACGGSVSVDGADGGTDTKTPGSDAPIGSDASLPHPPKVHRPAPTTCSTPPLPPEPDLSSHTFGPGATFDCKSHADCTAGKNGRCIVVDTSPPTERGGTRCVYSTCNVDVDCTGVVCQCGSIANTCIPGNCRVDADCASGYCSPSYDMCGGGITGYWCHTAADECIDDGDCDATHFKTHCEIDPTSARWVCPAAMCGA